MTTKPVVTTPLGKLTEGDQIHFKTSTTAWGYVRGRGETLTLTAEQIENSVDQLGRSWLDSVDDPEARIDRGPWPDGEPRWSYGDPMWEEQRESARRVAWSHVDPKVRAQALREVDLIFGPPPATSWTTNAAEDPSIGLAEEQEQRRRQAGVAIRSSYAPIERVNP